MSTPTIETPPVEAANEPNRERPKLELSVTTVIAGAMASITAAYLGSELGTAGTIIGAAVGSTIGAVASALYAYGLKRTTHTVATLADRTRRTSPSGGSETTDSLATGTGPEATPADRKRRVGLITAILGALVAAAAAFGISLVLITGIEASTGQSLDGGSGTTVTRIASASDESDSASSEDTSTDSADTTDTTTTATPTPTPTPSVEATPETTPEPTPSATTSATPEATETSTSAATPGA